MIDPTKEQIDAAAKAIAETGTSIRYSWESLGPSLRGLYSEEARAALVAAAAVPVEPVRIPDRLEVDEAKLADVIWEEQSSRVLDGYVIHTRATAATTAAAVAEWLRGGGR